MANNYEVMASQTLYFEFTIEADSEDKAWAKAEELMQDENEFAYKVVKKGSMGDDVSVDDSFPISVDDVNEV